MDFNQIRYFLALANTLNFTRAAEECAVSQPALTQAIRRLESELGGPLVNRDGVRTSLTDLGKTLFSKFQQIDDTRQLVKTTAQAVVSGSQATLNIGIMCTIGPTVISGFFHAFLGHHRDIKLVLHDVLPANIPQLLASGAVDAVFCSRSGAVQQRIRYTSLYTEAMVVAFKEGHQFSERTSVSMVEVAGEPYVDRLLCEFRPRFFEYIDEQKLSVDVVAASQREDWVQSMVAQGAGVTVLPQYSRIDPGVALCPLSDEMTREVELATSNSAHLSVALQNLVSAAENFRWSTQAGG